MGQDTQDLRKSLDKIKQQKIKLNKDERNSTNNKNENDRVNMILSLIDRIYQFFEYKFFSGEQSDELKLPKMGKSKLKKDWMRYWVQLLKLNKIGGLRINVDGREITLDNTESLLKDLGNAILDGHEFKNRYNNIANDVEAIVNKPLITRNEEKIVDIMSLLKEILKTKSDEKKQILQTCLN